jgi:inner membrane protein
MFPEAHLVMSWVIAAKATDNARDCRLATLAGILPDADGAGIFVDMVSAHLGHKSTNYYQLYHHFLLHGAFGAVVISTAVACFARRRLRVALLALVLVHLHILCDFIGSRGPGSEDLWPIFYLGPFTKDPMWIWRGQLPLDAWPFRILTITLFLCALWMAVPRGYSFVGVFSQRLDQKFVPVLQKWHAAFVAQCTRLQ